MPISRHSQPLLADMSVSCQPVLQLPTEQVPMAHEGVPLVIGQPEVQLPPVAVRGISENGFTGSSVSMEIDPERLAIVCARNSTSKATRALRSSGIGSTGRFLKVKRFDVPPTKVIRLMLSAP